jgi:hypothetical protein
MKNRYLITVGGGTYADPESVWCACEGETLAANCKEAALDNPDDGAVQVWQLTPVEVKATSHEVLHLPEDARPKPEPKRAGPRKRR